MLNRLIYGPWESRSFSKVVLGWGMEEEDITFQTLSYRTFRKDIVSYYKRVPASLRGEVGFLSVDDGFFILNMVREVVLCNLKDRSWTEKPKSFAESLTRKQGVFVSIIEKFARESEAREKYVLSIGNPLPSVSLIDTAFSAATKVAIDMSADPSTTLRLGKYVIRIDIVGDLEPLEVVNPMKYIDLIRLGHDGLMVERGHYKGTILPRVPIANNWSTEDLLSQCCIRAGLMADAWLQNVVRIYRFKTQVFEDRLAQESDTRELSREAIKSEP